MGALLPSMPNLGAGLSLNAGARIPAGINYEYFFDRSRVINAMSKAKRAALYKGGSVVMQIARRSIKRQGMARPKLQVMNENPDQTIRDLIGMSEASGNRRQANQLRRRLLEIQAKAPSAPGTPPHTHRGNLRDRPGIVYAYDPTSESVVVGQGSPSIAWLAALHEFGGTEQMIGWAWIPRWPRSYRAGIIGYWRVGRSPKRLNRWEQTSFRENVPYPERPYMRPAFAKAISTGRIAKEFANRFKVGGL
jgi:hypothetical protein